MKIDYTQIKPYGDTLNDGAVQISFTLPLSASEEAMETAKRLVQNMGFEDVQVVFTENMGEGFSFYILYGKTKLSIDFTKVKVPKLNTEKMDFYEINEFIEKEIGRKITVIAACTGTDAHTVGIDAIMNMKGYAGEYGLERYPMINAYNLGAQVENEELIRKAIEMHADVVLVSQVVTQKNVHIHNMTNLVELAEAEGIRERILLICGGPRINNELALELGFDAGFGSGTLPPHVASYIVRELKARGI